MTRQTQAAEVNSFVRGLITEASPLTFPENASLDEDNFVLKRDGSRERRLGIDFERDYQVVDTGLVDLPEGEIASSSFSWENAGGVPERLFIVVQVGTTLRFFDPDQGPLSAGLVHALDLEEADSDQVFSYANIDGRLVVATGEKDVQIFNWQDGEVVRTQDFLRIRDQFGVEDRLSVAALWDNFNDMSTNGSFYFDSFSGAWSYTFDSGVPMGTSVGESFSVREISTDNVVQVTINVARQDGTGNLIITPSSSGQLDPPPGEAGERDLFDGSGVALRPPSLTQAHLYNLRNQTWAMPKEVPGSRDPVDIVFNFHDYKGVYPSNSDNSNRALYADAQDSSNRTGDQFFREDLFSNPQGSFPAAKGFFIIDAMERGKSRLEKAAQLYSDNPVLQTSIETLPTDRTPGGPSVLSEFAGRVFYAGFSGSVDGGDNRSPRLSSYVLYSKLVQSPSDITECYQEGDPTSKESPDLLDTDGGFIRIDGAYNIQALINVGPALMVIAENGVWAIMGGSDFGFTANNAMRVKISEHGIQAPGSVVVVDNTLFFWADDAIYHVSQNEFGDWQANNITEQTIQSFYDEISPADKRYCQGSFDSYERRIRWLFRNRVESSEDVGELVFDTSLGAFYTNTFKTPAGSIFPRPLSLVEVPPFRVSESVEEVVFEGEPVEEEGQQVVETIQRRGSGIRELVYLTALGTNPITYTFSSFIDEEFRDWFSVDNEGVDAEAFLVTGYLSGGDFLRFKQVPYAQFHFIRTEDGFEDDGSGNLFPINPSSCLVQAQWEWANSANSNRWGREFQAYRYRRLYMPTGPADPFDSGFEVITTKNKIRGKGKVLSFLIKTEPGKDCKLLGWSMLLGVNGNV